MIILINKSRLSVLCLVALLGSCISNLTSKNNMLQTSSLQQQDSQINQDKEENKTKPQKEEKYKLKKVEPEGDDEDINKSSYYIFLPLNAYTKIADIGEPYQNIMKNIVYIEYGLSDEKIMFFGVETSGKDENTIHKKVKSTGKGCNLEKVIFSDNTLKKALTGDSFTPYKILILKWKGGFYIAKRINFNWNKKMKNFKNSPTSILNWGKENHLPAIKKALGLI